MLLHVWCQALVVTTASRQCCRSCTGFRFDVGWISRWQPWSTCHCLAPAWLQPSHRLSVGLRRKLSSAAFCHIKDVCCETNLQQLWDKCFAGAGPKLWNSLLAELRQAGITLWLTVKAAPHKFSYHRLRGSASPVLTATHHSYGSPRLSDFFSAHAWRSDPPTDFDAKWLKRRGFTQGWYFCSNKKAQLMLAYPRDAKTMKKIPPFRSYNKFQSSRKSGVYSN